ncbi:uroporphyrinogen-III synthase [Paenibacillus larvae]|uniref:uroporphyrinogen-III synthase n=1 Tax=Paenibacillus larvae TaxID=1464 RepID=UPI0035A632B6
MTSLSEYKENIVYFCGNCTFFHSAIAGSRNSYDFVCFSSSSTVDNLLSVLSREEKALLRSLKLLSIGPMTSRTIREKGFEVYREAALPEALIDLLLEEAGEVVPT